MQKCPGADCPEYIEKSIDCNHMKCKTCGTEFCYKCGGFYPGEHK